MPFVYRLQKILDFRIRKKEEQQAVVQKAKQALFICDENIRKNDEEINETKLNQRHAEALMMETYDKYLHHLWEKGKELDELRQKAQEHLNAETKKLVELEQACKVLEKHKDKMKEAYLAEEKSAELKKYSELGVQRHFRNAQEVKEENEALQKIIEESELDEY